MIWRGIAYVWYPMTIPATSNMHKLNYVRDMIGWSRVQPSLLGEAPGTERAAEIEPMASTKVALSLQGLSLAKSRRKGSSGLLLLLLLLLLTR